MEVFGGERCQQMVFKAAKRHSGVPPKKNGQPKDK